MEAFLISTLMLPVICGTTLANIPVIMLGQVGCGRLAVRLFRYRAAIIFI